MNRELDGCYFRIVRDGVGRSVCFTDLTKEERTALLAEKDEQFLRNLWRKGNEAVILGAFGCGAFRNPPAVVAQAMKTVVQECRKNFETIEFAVYCSPRDDANYRVFQSVLGGL